MATARRSAIAALVALAAITVGSAPAAAAAKFARLFTAESSSGHPVAMTRAADGSLHLVYQTFAGPTLSGLGAMSITAAGKPGLPVQALSGWQAGQPGLVALPGGMLEAAFGATSPNNVTSVWGITSSDGGSTWSAPQSVLGGGSDESLAYGSNITAAMAGTTPILALPQAGNVVIQRGLGAGSPSYTLTTSADGSTTDAALAADASTGEVVAGWQSIAGKLTDYLQGAAPTIAAAQALPGQDRNSMELAGRDSGPGVYAAYTPDGSHVRLARYGSGTVAVGRRPGTTAKVLSVATGIAGRIWVMWGDDSAGGVAVTRSNRAVTRFEPIQHLDPHSFSLLHISGDGRLGPLDLLVDQIPTTKGPAQPPSEYYARVLPELSVSISVKTIKKGAQKVVGHKLRVRVSDAGDAVASASVSIHGQKKKTNKSGLAKVKLPGSLSGFFTVTIHEPGYLTLQRRVKL